MDNYCSKHNFIKLSIAGVFINGSDSVLYYFIFSMLSMELIT